MIEIVHKNLFDTKKRIIIHQVNTEGVMGIGVAKEIKKRFPNVYQTYHAVCQKYKTDELIGKIQIIATNPNDLNKTGNLVINLFAESLGKQLDKSGRKTDYNALRTGFRKIASLKEDIAIPYKMGCGLGKGDWNIVLQIIKEECRDINVEICNLKNVPQMTWYPSVQSSFK